jgi:uncharacterized integral membrane protein
MTGPPYDDRGGAPDADPYRREPGAEPAGTTAGQYERARPEAAPSAPATPAKVPGRTRVSGIWVASIAAVVVLLLLLIFILQNGDRVKINIFGANPTLPVGVALLLAAVLGALLVALIGAARVVQLRNTARRIARKSR